MEEWKVIIGCTGLVMIVKLNNIWNEHIPYCEMICYSRNLIWISFFLYLIHLSISKCCVKFNIDYYYFILFYVWSVAFFIIIYWNYELLFYAKIGVKGIFRDNAIQMVI